MRELIHLGAWGRTIFSFRPTRGIEGDKLVLRTREGAIEIGQAEIVTIAALAQAVGLVPDPKIITILKGKLGT